MTTDRPQLYGTFGMVAAANPLAATVGMAMLEVGGNAFDAAVAVGFVLQVVEPHMCGPGGEVPIVFARGDDKQPRVLCGQGPAPSAATPLYFSQLGMDAVPGSGLLPAAVPGAFDAWALLLRDHGTRTLREVLGPAIGYAEKGYPLPSYMCRCIDQMESIFRDHWPTSAALYLRTSGSAKPFTIQRNPALAATYRRVLDEAEAAGRDRIAQIDAARRTWYQGFVATAIEEFARVPRWDRTGESHAGLLTAEDLARYRASYEDPVALDWEGWTVCKPGPWSQGPVMLQHLALLGGNPLAGEAANATDRADRIHHIIEAAKLAFADRDAHYGDVSDVPLTALLSKDYAAERRLLITQTAAQELQPGRPDGREPRMPRMPCRVPDSVPETWPSPFEPLVRGDTCHLDTVDRFGNIVSATPSGGYFMASPVIDTLGFPLGNRLEMTCLDEGLPNTLHPGRRPRTTLSPTLALRDGEPVLAFGCPGADMQDQVSLCFFLEFAAGLPLQEAMERPRWYTFHLAGSRFPHEVELGHLAVEESVGTETIAELRKRGHRVETHRSRSLGRASAVGRDPRIGTLYAAADPRGLTYACGR